MVRNLRQWTTLLIWEATLVPRTVFRRISQLELTKQETVIAAFVTYGNQKYIAWRQNFDSNVISVLLYGCQTQSWRVSKDDMNKLDVFQTKCLRRTCNIFWPNKISNEDLYRRTNSSPISTQIQKHRLRWLGHVLRMPQDSIPKVALRWTPTGKRNRGCPKTTWRRTITTELSDIGLTMGEAQVFAQDRHRWRRDMMKRISKVSTSYHIHQLFMEIWSKSKACQICALGCSTGESLRNTTVRKHCSKCRWDIIATVEGIMAHNDLQWPQYLCSDDVTSDNSSIKRCMRCWWQCAAGGVWTPRWDTLWVDKETSNYLSGWYSRPWNASMCLVVWLFYTNYQFI